MYKEFITDVSKLFPALKPNVYLNLRSHLEINCHFINGWREKEKINQNVFQLQATAEQDIDNMLQDESWEACLMHCTHCTQQ